VNSLSTDKQEPLLSKR